MKSACLLVAVVVFASPAFASDNFDGGDFGMLAAVFLGFGSFIISSKLIPGIIRMAAILRPEAPPAEAEPAAPPAKSI